jgi:putative PIN family toxin of toxin-antitoxin system
MWRVLFDANIFISYLLNPTGTSPINRVVNLCFTDEIRTVITSELLEEIERKATTKPDLAKRIPPRVVELLIESLLDIAEVVTAEPSPERFRLRDIKNTYLLRASEAGDVDFLVTGDRDLLDERDDIPRPLIVTAAELLVLLDETYNK